MSTSVKALFNKPAEASIAVDSLIAQGVPQKNISVLMAESTRDKEFNIQVNSKAPEGAATGAAIGGAIGAIAAGLTTVGAVALTGGAGIIAAGPLVAALAGGGAGAAAGGVTGGLIGLGFDENEAKLVDKDLENGSVLVAVDVEGDQKDTYKTVFDNCGAKKVTTT